MLESERRILSILSGLAYRYNLDRANIMITGFSGGGFPSYFVGLRNPEVFSVVAARKCNFNRANLDGWWPAEARRLEPLLSEKIFKAYRVPDATVDPFRLALENVDHARMLTDSIYRPHTEIIRFEIDAGEIRESVFLYIVTCNLKISHI